MVIVGFPNTEYTVNVATEEVWFSGGFAFVVPVSVTFTVMEWAVPDADPVNVSADSVQVFVVSPVQSDIAVPLSYHVYESVPVPPDAVAVRVIAWSADITEAVWSIVGTPNAVYTIIFVADEVSVSDDTAHGDVPASVTVTVIEWAVPDADPT